MRVRWECEAECEVGVLGECDGSTRAVLTPLRIPSHSFGAAKQLAPDVVRELDQLEDVGVRFTKRLNPRQRKALKRKGLQASAFDGGV